MTDPRSTPSIPVAPQKHMRQSMNGCVTCSKKWRDHTLAEAMPLTHGETRPTPVGPEARPDPDWETIDAELAEHEGDFDSEPFSRRLAVEPEARPRFDVDNPLGVTDSPPKPQTKRGKHLLSELPELVRGPWTPFREEQFGGTIAIIEEEARRLAVEPDGLPLDVGRLASALENMDPAMVAYFIRDDWKGTPRKFAQDLAAEYSRLASTPSEAKP